MSTNEQINNVMSIINELIIDIAIFDGMKSLASKYENNDTFNSLYNNNAMMIVIRLSNIFGKDYEDNHWKKYIDDHTPSGTTPDYSSLEYRVNYFKDGKLYLSNDYLGRAELFQNELFNKVYTSVFKTNFGAVVNTID